MGLGKTYATNRNTTLSRFFFTLFYFVIFGNPERIMNLLAFAVFGEIEISHLCNASTTVGPLEPHFLGQGAIMSNVY